MTDLSVVDFRKLRGLIESGSSGVVDVRADLHRALAEMDWNAQRRPAVQPITQPEAERLLTPEQVVEIAGLPRETSDETRRSIARIYSWAKGQKWAVRPSRRCLRINEGAFRKWLSARAGGAR